jgi:hypothetical protein
LYAQLPAQVQSQTKRTYRLFLQNPSHPELNFKKIDEENDICSARVGLGYRVLGQTDGTEIVWFWIGSHADYDKRI